MGMLRSLDGLLCTMAACFVLVACGGDSDGGDSVTTEHCQYAELVSTAGAGGTVTAGALEAGAAEAVLPIPVGAALGSYTARAGFLGSAGTVDLRKVAISGNFNASTGIETAPKVRVVALSAGGGIAILIKIDIGFIYEGMVFDLENRLGPDYSGKVIITASHSHSAWGHYTGHSAYQMGAGVLRKLAYDRFLDAMESTVKAAVAAQRLAKIGIFADMSWDPDNRITRDRRGENDEMMGGSRKDDAFFMIRIDGTDDLPIAVMPVYGVHGTINGEDNSFASTDSTGGVERWLEEQFDSHVVVMHLQGAGADVSPTPRGGLDCSIKPGDQDDPCLDWLRVDAHGREAVATLYSAWEQAGASMQTQVEVEMLTKSVELGPNYETFTIRGGALEYAPFDYERTDSDGIIFDSAGNVASPIDEFNAPIGAGLCEDSEVLFAAAEIPGTRALHPYGSCARVAEMGDIFEILLNTTFESDATHPVCQSTRTTLSALRIGEYVFGTIPGELSVLLADYLRENSPVAPNKTILLGYAQGHTGYSMMPEDWLLGGYESSINIWGPLEAEYLGEQLVALMPMAMTAEREDAASTASDRFVTPSVTDDLPIDDPAPMQGTIPSTVPERVWLRTGPAATAQPPATVRRVDGIATFVFIGEDPLVATPVITLQREASTDVYEDVTRRSGRKVQDGDLILAYTPQPLRREDAPQTHYWAVEWQAVPWTGADDGAVNLDGLGARAGVPLGKYRFHVKAKSFELTSDPFEVVAANLRVTTGRSGNMISATVQLHAPQGFRVLDMQLDSNVPVPVRDGLFDVELTLSAGGPLSFSDVAITTDGTLSVDAGSDAANVTAVKVTDAYDNTKTAALN